MRAAYLVAPCLFGHSLSSLHSSAPLQLLPYMAPNRCLRAHAAHGAAHSQQVHEAGTRVSHRSSDWSRLALESMLQQPCTVQACQSRMQCNPLYAGDGASSKTQGELHAAVSGCSYPFSKGLTDYTVWDALNYAHSWQCARLQLCKA